MNGLLAECLYFWQLYGLLRDTELGEADND